MAASMMKKVYNILKVNILIFILMLGIGAPLLQAHAATEDIYNYVTEFSLNDVSWKYGEPMKGGSVGHNEPVSVRYTLYFTKTQWKAIVQNGKVVLDWKLPDGVNIINVEQEVISKVDSKQQSIGTLEVVDSNVTISISEEYTEIISYNDNVEINMGVTMQFEEGVYDLGEIIKVEAKESGHASALWNNYSVKINKIAANDDSKLLAGAYFEIDEYKYSEDSRAFKDCVLFNPRERELEDNGTYVFSGNGFETIEDKTALLVGGFEPGNLYVLREVKAPIGYLPSKEPLKFAFYRYTESDKEGTLNKIQELNAAYKNRYENEGGVASFGSEVGRARSAEQNIYVTNTKVPKLQVLKIDANTGAAISKVAFTLQLDAKKANYTVEQYLNIKNAEWEYDASTGKLFWEMKTDDKGMISYPEGTIPYCGTDYVLMEKVPKGYEGYGGTKTVSFKLDQEGNVTVTGGSAVAETVEGVITIKVENRRTADLSIYKCDETGKRLAGAVFALYGPEVRNTDDILEKDGKKYYYIGEKTTGTEGEVVFANLVYGNYYLVEKEAPEGYHIIEEPRLVELKEGTVQDTICTVKVINRKKDPHITGTGGKGIGPYIAGGAVLLVLGSIFFLAAQKKKRLKAKRRAKVARRRAEEQRRNG